MGKKIVAVFAFVFVCQAGFCQKNIDQLFNEFSKDAGTTKIKIGKFAMAFVDLFQDTMGVDGIEVLEFSDCADHVKKQFNEAIHRLEDPSFDTIIRTNEEGSRTRVMIRIKDDVIRELVVLTSGSGAALVRIKGKIRRSDIEKLVNEHS